MTGVPELRGAVHDREAADGLCGGSAHIAAAVRRTGEQIAALDAGGHRHHRDAAVARTEEPAPVALGVGGRLSPYDPAGLAGG